jgi:hypothetical protein
MSPLIVGYEENRVIILRATSSVVQDVIHNLLFLSYHAMKCDVTLLLEEWTAIRKENSIPILKKTDRPPSERYSNLVFKETTETWREPNETDECSPKVRVIKY